tara:strand:+ start:190 stop:1227 length:1038 start_codon:yes stop_codon:yes gene_type:complete
MGDYGSEADRINDMIRQHKEAYTSGLGDEANSLQTLATENWNSSSADYLSKYGHLAEGGGAEIAGAFGLKGIYKGGQNLKGLYDKYKTKASDSNDPLVENDSGNPQGINNEVPENLRPEDVPQTGEAPEISTDDITSGDAFDFIRTEGGVDVPLTQTTPQPRPETEASPEVEETSFMDRPAPAPALSEEQVRFPRITASDPAPQSTAPAPVQDLDEPEDKFEDAPEEPIAGETENLVEQATKQTAETATKDIGEGLVEKGLTSGVGDLVAGAIPVVGEGILAVAGLVSIGEGIYHLFHHKSKQPVVSTVATGAMPSAPSNLTQKYSLALPSIDSASEASASVSSF